MDSYFNLTVKELKKELVAQEVPFDPKDTKEVLLKKLFIHNFEKKLSIKPQEKTCIFTKTLEPRKQRYISLEHREIFSQQLQDIQKFRPNIEVYQEQGQTLKNYDEIFEVQELLYQHKELSICKLKNGMYMCINKETVHVCESMEIVIKNLTGDEYTRFYIHTEKLDNFGELRNDEKRHMKIPSRFDYMMYIYYKILTVETTFESLDANNYKELKPNVDEIYWTHFGTVNLILYRNGRNFCLIRYKFKPESFIKVMNRYTSKSYSHLINVLSANEYKEYLAATRSDRSFELIKKEIETSLIEEFTRLHSEIRGEAIDIRNLTKEPAKFRGLSLIEEYYVLNLNRDGNSKSIAIFKTSDKKYVAYTFYISSKCTRDFRCIVYMQDIKEYTADTYDDLINGFSESDFQTYLKV